eukprot:Cvel_21096.t1-p1 / transcript=Cvel_21096.t1 / gene=Cvel_21096 / organism=Chromera_velia_CCMP2878 / gene_product=hypothetical protein / transcript_product=hypothetical protein / location=Cvel_scaffold1950:32581-35870(+) / protein_length=929 / sequence_SO=supercontig / SO=protein_coding / is_pseudo=false
MSYPYYADEWRQSEVSSPPSRPGKRVTISPSAVSIDGSDIRIRGEIFDGSADDEGDGQTLKTMQTAESYYERNRDSRRHMEDQRARQEEYFSRGEGYYSASAYETDGRPVADHYSYHNYPYGTQPKPSPPYHEDVHVPPTTVYADHGSPSTQSPSIGGTSPARDHHGRSEDPGTHTEGRPRMGPLRSQQHQTQSQGRGVTIPLWRGRPYSRPRASSPQSPPGGYGPRRESSWAPPMQPYPEDPHRGPPPRRWRNFPFSPDDWNVPQMRRQQRDATEGRRSPGHGPGTGGYPMMSRGEYWFHPGGQESHMPPPNRGTHPHGGRGRPEGPPPERGSVPPHWHQQRDRRPREREHAAAPGEAPEVPYASSHEEEQNAMPAESRAAEHLDQSPSGRRKSPSQAQRVRFQREQTTHPDRQSRTPYGEATPPVHQPPRREKETPAQYHPTPNYPQPQHQMPPPQFQQPAFFPPQRSRSHVLALPPGTVMSSVPVSTQQQQHPQFSNPDHRAPPQQARPSQHPQQRRPWFWGRAGGPSAPLMRRGASRTDSPQRTTGPPSHSQVPMQGPRTQQVKGKAPPSRGPPPPPAARLAPLPPNGTPVRARVFRQTFALPMAHGKTPTAPHIPLQGFPPSPYSGDGRVQEGDAESPLQGQANVERLNESFIEDLQRSQDVWRHQQEHQQEQVQQQQNQNMHQGTNEPPQQQHQPVPQPRPPSARTAKSREDSPSSHPRTQTHHQAPSSGPIVHRLVVVPPPPDSEEQARQPTDTVQEEAPESTGGESQSQAIDRGRKQTDAAAPPAPRNSTKTSTAALREKGPLVPLLPLSGIGAQLASPPKLVVFQHAQAVHAAPPPEHFLPYQPQQVYHQPYQPHAAAPYFAPAPLPHPVQTVHPPLPFSSPVQFQHVPLMHPSTPHRPPSPPQTISAATAVRPPTRLVQ